ncbi:MAG: hypothetical protein ACLP9L_08950 [Thermoguttaceae bacterium]
MVCSSPAPAPRRRWHRQFLALLPAIIQHAKIAFRHVRGQDRQDKIQETVANALVAFRRLVQLKKTDLAYPSVLARYAVAQIKDGQMVGGKMNCRDVSSPYCQRVKGVVLERLDCYDADDECWQEVLVPDKTCTPAELAAARIDVNAWFKSLPRRDRKVAEFLAAGQTTSAAARKFKVSDGRISQLRRELANNWRDFISDDHGPANAA